MIHEALITGEGDNTVAECTVSGKRGYGSAYWGAPETVLSELDDKCKPARHICPTAATWRPEE